MKQMGRWVPIPDLLEWWIPLAIALPACIFFLYKAWRYRKDYFHWMIGFHFFYLGWCIVRGVGAILISDRLSDTAYYLRALVLLLAVFLVLSTYSTTKRRVEGRRDERARLAGPDEILWSPDPIVGFRWSIHSMRDETYTGSRAFCRAGTIYHSSADVPMWGCRCGYYAMKSPGMMGSSLAVIVFMWGRVIEHAGGYRSEYMRPIGYFNTYGKSLPAMSLRWALTGHDYFENFNYLPIAQNQQELDALIEKARKEFDPAAPPPYDGDHNGYRKTPTED